MQPRELRSHVDAQLRVEIRKGLVHQECARLAHDCAPHRDTLALAAGQRGGPPLQKLLEAEHRGNLTHAALDLVLRRVPHAQAVGEVLRNGQMRIQRVVLEDHGDVAVARREVRDISVADRDRPARDLFEPRDHAEQRRLAAPGRPDQDEELAVRDVEAHAVDGADTAAELLRHLLDRDLGHARSLRT